MMEELGQPYRVEVMGYGDTMKSEDYLAINPMGKVPALTHGAVVVTECAGDLRLSGRRLSRRGAGAAIGIA
jgi:glutathione S-transferase